MRQRIFSRRSAVMFLLCLSAFSHSLKTAIADSSSSEIHYGTGDWDSASLGNQRVVLQVAQGADAVFAHILWRRHDVAPEKKNVLVVEAATGLVVSNRVCLAVNSEFGDLVFQAQKAGTYYAYYLPSVAKGKNYPSVSYQKPDDKSDAAWLSKIGFETKDGRMAAAAKLPVAQVTEMQSIDEFNSFYPMEVAATADEQRQLIADHSGQPFLLFPEDRMFPIRMSDRLPLKWIHGGPRAEFAGEAAPGEFYSFQVGLFADTASLSNVAVSFTDLKSAEGGKTIASAALRCINTGGTNWRGAAFAKNVSVAKGHVQALWMGVQIPENARPGKFQGMVTIHPAGQPAQTVRFALSIAGQPLADHGDSEPSRQTRLRWLDSTLEQDDEVVRPYSPVKVSRDAVQILGRKLTLGASGFPTQVTSYFSPEGTEIEKTGLSLLTAPMRLIAEQMGGQALEWSNSVCKFTKKTEGSAEWIARSESGPLILEVRGHMEFDGFVQYQVSVTSSETVDLADLRLEIPMDQARAKYLMGLGVQGSRCPESMDWSWDVKKHQDSAWLGDVGIGLQFKLKDENYEPPLLTNFYEDKPIKMPPAWFNGGRGGIALRRMNGTLLVRCFGGKRRLERGMRLHFDFDLLLTPFKKMNTAQQWSTRFFHSYKPVADVVQSGANTVNIHHANEANPYINYPFLHVKQMREYIAEAHARHLKVKIYDTMRELSNHAQELFAMRSLGDEIFADGKGGGDAWLQEHLGTNYMPAWFVPQWKDAALIDKGSTRWDNYYVEGIAWLVKNVGIDGLYIDDLAYDRVTMKRVRKALDRGNPGALIDFHSANQYDPHDGFGSCANVYMEHFPYLDRLWFGEYFNPDSPSDFWLVEMSGIPFGMMGEMLQDGGNRWRGMLYGMTSRIPYDGNDPSPIWKVWDTFRIQDSKMVGYWSPRCPVRTDSTNILATVYVGHGKSLISIASWATNDSSVKLTCDWKALGIDPAKAMLTAPEMAGFQPAARFKAADAIPVPKGKGWLLYLADE